MRSLKKFNERSKGDKALRIVNLVLSLAIFGASIGMLIYNIVRGDPNHKIFACSMIAVCAILPLALEYIFGFNFPQVMFLGYEIYIIFAGFWGSVLSGYKNFEHFDTVIHTFMGYFVAMLGIYVIARVGDYRKLSPWLIILFCLCFSLGVELIWEIFEFICDRVLGQTAQGIPPEGFKVPLVTDTIYDLICNLSGATIFAIHFIIGKCTRAKVGITQIEKQLAKGQVSSFQKENEKDENLS